MKRKIRYLFSILMLGVFMANFVLAQTAGANQSNLSQYTTQAKETLLAANSPICKLLGVLNLLGAVAMTSGVLLAGYNFLSASQEAREKGKIGAEGILIGGGLIGLAPTIVQYVFGFAIC